MKKKLVILSFIIIAFAFGNARSQSDVTQNQEAQTAEARRRVTLPPSVTKFDSAVVNVPMLGSKTLPLVEVKLNGRGSYKFLLDSAANVTMLQMRVADELKLPVLRPGETSKLLALNSLQIGNAHFEDLVVGARRWNEPIDGILGFSVFADCLLTMDYTRQQIILRKGSLPSANGKDIFKYGLDNRSPTLEITIGNERLSILVDTGAAQGVVITEAIASKLRFTKGLSPGPNLSTFETGQSRALTGRLSGNITIGIHEISEPKIHVWNDVPVIGSGLFKDFVLTFDQKNQTLKISV